MKVRQPLLCCWLMTIICLSAVQTHPNDFDYENDDDESDFDRILEELPDEVIIEISESITTYESTSSTCSFCLLKDKFTGYEREDIHRSDQHKRTLVQVLSSLNNRKKVEKFLTAFQKQLGIKRRHVNLLLWNKDTNLTTHNSKIYIAASLKFSAWEKAMRKVASSTLSYHGLNCSETRMLKDILKTSSPSQASLRTESANLYSTIEAVYSKAKVCKSGQPKKCYSYEPGIISIMSKSRNYSELLWAWKGWRDAIGPKIRNSWYRIIEISNIGAKEHGYVDEGAYWRSRYEVSNLKERVDNLWNEIKPMYEQLHAYVRHKLHLVYGSKVNKTGPIPAHLLGDIWGMQWGNIYDICAPYPKIEAFQVTKGMKEKNFTAMKMFHLADEFYRSMGLPPMTPTFWNKSMFVKPKGRSVVCYASAFNLEKDDVRVKMCAQVNSEYLYVVHHEMGHCQYYLAYNRHQPELFQKGANNGFHEAIGDTAALSVISPTHLIKLGILKKSKDKNKRYQKTINFLMKKALSKIAFYQFALSLESWRWEVFSGKITKQNLNAAWWEKKLHYGGLVPPVARSEHDFDPGAKYHVVYGVPYIRYFISYMIQFQFFEKLCDTSGHKGALYLCDFAGSKKAGAKFMDMLNMGASKHWEDAMRSLTGSCHMTAKSVKRYFKPLVTWLTKENKRLGNKIGW